MKLSTTTLFILTAFIAFSLAIVFEGAQGITVGGNLNLGGNKITGLPVPAAGGELANWDFVNSTMSLFQNRITGTCPGSIIQTVHANGSVNCL